MNVSVYNSNPPDSTPAMCQIVEREKYFKSLSVNEPAVIWRSSPLRTIPDIFKSWSVIMSCAGRFRFACSAASLGDCPIVKKSSDPCVTSRGAFETKRNESRVTFGEGRLGSAAAHPTSRLNIGIAKLSGFKGYLRLFIDQKTVDLRF